VETLSPLDDACHFVAGKLMYAQGSSAMTAVTATRGSTLARLALMTIFASAALMLAVAALGAASPFGFLVTVPPLYLMWVWVIDVSALLRNRSRSSKSYVARPHYWLWIAGCALPIAAWTAWASIAFHR
jgi:hypothetical protein